MSLCVACGSIIDSDSGSNETRYLCRRCFAEDGDETQRSATPGNSVSQTDTLITPPFARLRKTDESESLPPLISTERKRKVGASMETTLSAKADDFTETERVKRRAMLTAEAFGFKSLTPEPSPSNSDNESEQEEIASAMRVKSVGEILPKKQYASKRFKDQVWGHIELPALCIAVMDTPQFQRLRNLKQLGAAYFVFPGASHNRFEHSIGVAWLAGVLMRRLRDVQPELGLTNADIELVQVTGLVHDLGHGPYSHMFDGQFIPRMRPDLNNTYCHEQMTVQLLDLLLKENNIDLRQFGLDPDRDVAFIKECILGAKIPGGLKGRRGRGREKAFMYDVINNVSCGMDVDRLDYYERDARNTCVKSGCDVQRLIAESRVVDVQGFPRIVFPDKLVGDVLAAYQTRFRLHNAVYQHKVVKAIELMIVDALVAADKANVFSFRGSDRRDYSLGECIDDSVAFCLAQDDVLQQIRTSRNIEALGARSIIRRLDTRELYRSVGEVSIRRPNNGSDWSQSVTVHGIRSEEMPMEEDEFENPNTFSQIERRNTELYQVFDQSEEEIKRQLLETKAARLVDLSEADVIVEKMRVHHGSMAQNPLDSVYFYSKLNPDRARILHQSKYESLCPATFMKEAIRVFSTSTSPHVTAAVHDAFRELTDTRPFLSTNATPMISPPTSPNELG